MMTSREYFFESVYKLRLTNSQLEAIGSLYDVLNADNEDLGDVVNTVNNEMNDFMDSIISRPHTKEEAFAKINRKWAELRERYHLPVKEDNWFNVDLGELVKTPEHKIYEENPKAKVYHAQKEDDIKMKIWLNKQFDKLDKSRKSFSKYLDWERDALEHKMRDRGEGISAYAHSQDVQAALHSSNPKDFFDSCCMKKKDASPLYSGFEIANADVYADMSNKMQYVVDVRYNGKIPDSIVDNFNKDLLCWYNVPVNGSSNMAKPIDGSKMV